MNQRTEALAGGQTEEMKMVAREEVVSYEGLRQRIASGQVVIPANRNHHELQLKGIGEGLCIKVYFRRGIEVGVLCIKAYGGLRSNQDGGKDPLYDVHQRPSINKCWRFKISFAARILGRNPPGMDFERRNSNDQTLS